MHAESPAIAVREHLEIAARLGGFDHAKSVFLPGDLEINRIIASDLQEYARVRAAFIGLTCGMEEARAEAKASRHLLSVPNDGTDLL